MTSLKKLTALRQKTISSTLQLISREVLMKVIAVIGQLLLIRLLAPSAFGVFAILSFLLSTAEIFSDIGLNFTIIQKKQQPTNRQLSTIFFIKLLLVGAIILILNISAPFLYVFYPQLTQSEVSMFRLMTLTLLLKPLQTTCIALLERNLRYKEIAVIDLSGIISYYVGAVVLALAGMGVWSFVWAVFIKTIIECIVTFVYKPWLPQWIFQINQIKSYLKLGKYFQFALFVGLIHNSIIPVLGGTRLSFTAVGYLDWSYNMASFPRIFVDNLGRVLFTSFSRIQSDKKTIAESIEKSFALLSVIAVYLLIITLMYGNDAVHFFLTDKWLPALPALYWYIASTFFMNGHGLFGQALLAVGKVKKIFAVSAVLTFIEIILALVFLTRFGFTGIAISFFITRVLTFFTYLFICQREKIKVRLTKIFITNAIIFVASIVFASSIDILFTSSLLSFFTKLTLTSFFFLLILLLVSPEVIKQLVALIKKKNF